MVFDFSPSDNFEVISELIEYTSHWEQHERDIHPKLREVEVMPNPCLITYHDDDICEYQERERSPEKNL